MILRLIPAILLGLGVSAGLFWLMHLMLEHQADFTNREAVTQVDFIRLQQEELPLETITRELPPPPEPELAKPPPDPALAAATPAATVSSAAPPFDMPKLALPVGGGAIAAPVTGMVDWSMSLPALETGSRPNEKALGGPEAAGNALAAIVRIPPTYPMEARRQKLEGWVKLEFTVQPDGAVAEVKVLDAKPPNIFNQAAIQAISQWKFRPALQDGKPVRKRAAQTLKFALDK